MVRIILPRSPHFSPPGFTLVEAVVAFTLLAVGLLGAVATQSLAARLLREAEAHAGAVALAGAVLDSLLAVPGPTAGDRRESRYQVRWSMHPHDATTTTEIVLEVAYHDGTMTRRLRFEILHSEPLPRIGGVE